MAAKERKKEITVACPVCGYEYLPAEIYYPKSFFGNPVDVDRTAEGKIDIYDGAPMCLTETYTCDRCGATFEVTADPRFKTKAVESTTSFDSTYSSPLHTTERISLPEDDLN